MLEKDRAEIFGKNLSRLMAEQKKTQADIVRCLGVSKSTASVWSGGQNIPRTDKIEALCKMFNVQFSDLLEEKPATNEDAELNEYLDELRNRSEMRMLFKLAKGATKEDVEQAVKIIEALRK